MAKPKRGSRISPEEADRIRVALGANSATPIDPVHADGPIGMLHQADSVRRLREAKAATSDLPTPPEGGFSSCQICGGLGSLARCQECRTEACETCRVDGGLCWGCNEARAVTEGGS